MSDGRAAPRRARILALVSIVLVLSITAIRYAVDRGDPRSAHASVRDGCFAFTIDLNQQAVPAGGTISFTVTARNVTRHDCAGPSCSGITSSYEVRDLFGRLVYRENAVGVACRSDAPPPQAIAADATTTWTVESWDGRESWHGVCKPGDCRLTRPVAAPGTYRIVWHLVSDMSVGSAWFRIT